MVRSHNNLKVVFPKLNPISLGALMLLNYGTYAQEALANVQSKLTIHKRDKTSKTHSTLIRWMLNVVELRYICPISLVCKYTHYT